MSVFSEELLIPTVICFCDIPSKSLNIHIQKYGRFGISIKKEHLIENGGRPVLYWPFILNDGRHFNGGIKDIWRSYHAFREMVYEPRECNFPETRFPENTIVDEDEAIEYFLSAVQFELLPYIKPFNARTSDQALENFYMEREWRKFGYLDFTPSSIHEIVVAAGYKKRLAAEFPQYASRVVEK